MFKIIIVSFLVSSFYVLSETPADERNKYKKDEINAMDGGDLCPKEFSKKYLHHMVLIDTTSPLSGPQRNLIKRLVLSDEYLKIMKPIDKLTIMRLYDVAPAANRPIFSKCRPRSGDRGSPYQIDHHDRLFENITEVAGPYKKLFVKGVNDAIDLIADPLTTNPNKSTKISGSPIMGQLKEISRLPDLDFTNNSGYETRRLTIVSDLAQNTERLPFYTLCPGNKACPSWEEFKNDKKYRLWAKQALPKFDSSIDVDIIFLNSNFDKQLDKGVLDFWFEFLEEAGIDYNSIDFDNETSYSPGS